MAMRMTLCGFCRRLTCERTEASPTNGEQEAGPLMTGPLLPDHCIIEDRYCRDCERFYHQLVTFGRGDSSVTVRNVPEPQVHEISQATITVGISA